MKKAPAPIIRNSGSSSASFILLDLDDQSLLRLLQNHQLSNQQVNAHLENILSDPRLYNDGYRQKLANVLQFMVSYQGGALDAKLSPLFVKAGTVLGGSRVYWSWMMHQAAMNGHWQLLEKLPLTSRQMHQLFKMEHQL